MDSLPPPETADCFVLVSTSEVFFSSQFFFQSPALTSHNGYRINCFDRPRRHYRNISPWAPSPFAATSTYACTTPGRSIFRQPKRPSVPSTGPHGAFLVELVTYNGHPYKGHWAFSVRCHASPDRGVYLHAMGDVLRGFDLEVRRSFDFKETRNPTDRIPLQWADGMHFDEMAMLNNHIHVRDDKPVCGFEASAMKVSAPGPSLNTVTGNSSCQSGRKVNQRNCQTWIVEAADQLRGDGIFTSETVAYLRAIQQ